MNQPNTMELLGRIRGLSETDVHRSKEQFGDNALTRNTRRSFAREFIANFGDPIIKILLIALIVNIVIQIRHFNWYETIGIAIAILVSTFVSTLSEYGSESAFEKLQEEALRTKCRVKRAGGLVELPVGDVVVGDIVLLQPGDRIPADGLITSGEIHVDQSPLNGESKEAVKKPGEESSRIEKSGFSSRNKLYRGCIVCSGEAIMRVDSVGANTFYGKLALDVQEAPRESPLKLRLGKLATVISLIGYIGAGLVALADLFHSIVIANGYQLDAALRFLETPKLLIASLIHAATLAISVVVMAIPEGLPLMITIVLSSNMKRMLKDNVLVRKLVGIETSGNLNILFTDKTGTITKGKLKVCFFINGNGAKLDDYSKFKRTEAGRLLRLSGAYNTAAYVSGLGENPAATGGKAGLLGKLADRRKSSEKGRTALGGNATERALLEFVLDDEQAASDLRIVASCPFTSANKFSSVQLKGALNLTLVKGAPELILPNCLYFIDTDGVRRDLTEVGRLKKIMSDAASDAARLIAVAVTDEAMNPSGINRNLTLVGIAGIRDEIRREAPKAIRQVASAGVQVVMITGDSPETASAIAAEVGLIRKGEDSAVVTSDVLQLMSDKELKAAIPHLRVVARAVPSDKSRLVALAQELGLVAGMTGDGINDAPALKKADVGFAMGSGTEVAKEAGDIVILDDNFLSISKAILYGRTIFKSIRKFIIFRLTMNLCAVAVSIIGPFIGINSPITVLQMLWVNMVMDSLAGLAFAGEAPLREYMEEPPKRRDEPIINKYMYNQILIGGIYMTLLCILFLKLPAIHTMYSHGTGDEFFMTAFFAMFIFAGVFSCFNARTTRLNLLAHVWKNKGFLAIMLLVMISQLLIIYFGGEIFRTTGLRYSELQFVIILAFSVVPVDFFRKSLVGSTHRGTAI
jgi:magnesium-transporting ATPase (P-type)